MTDDRFDGKLPDRELDQLLGRTVAGGKYRVLRLIGRGGMGAVYEVEHVTIGRRFAVKFVDRSLADDERVTRRFEREARAASAIESEHIVSVFDFGTDDGRPYIVMELLRGEDLGSRLARLRTIPVADALHIVAQVLRGLARAHAAGIVHRDLKPDNVLLVEQDDEPLFAKLVDFGISKIARLGGQTPLSLTQSGIVLGTPLFMSPEQAEARPDIDERSDLYSVGAILFECLAGRPPHVGETPDEILTRIRTEDAPSLGEVASGVPEPVVALVARALRRDRAARFQTALEMLAALREIAPSDPAAAPMSALSRQQLELARTIIDGESPFEPDQERRRPDGSAGRRLPVVVAAIAATITGVVVTVVVTGAAGSRPATARPVAASPPMRAAAPAPVSVPAPVPVSGRTPDTEASSLPVRAITPGASIDTDAASGRPAPPRPAASTARPVASTGGALDIDRSLPP
jgi:serine/threonine-protein kinase